MPVTLKPLAIMSTEIAFYAVSIHLVTVARVSLLSCPIGVFALLASGHAFLVTPAEFHFDWPTNADVGRVQHPREPARYHGQVRVRLAELLFHLVRQVAAKTVLH